MLTISYPVYIRDWRNRRLLDRSLKSIRFDEEHQIHLVINACDYPVFLTKAVAQYRAMVVQNEANSVAGAWRHAIRHGLNQAETDIVLLANQDVEFYPETLMKLTTAARQHEFVFGRPPRAQDRFSLWGGTIASFRKFAERDIDRKNCGLPDTQFTPAYYEDNDLDYRMRLSGMTQTAVDAPYKHKGSSVIRFNRAARKANRLSFAENSKRYIAKWGGLPGEEKFKIPYGENGET